MDDHTYLLEPQMIDVCYHHNDADGWASGAIVNAPINLAVGYHTKLNNSAILNTCSGKVVAIVDFSFPRETMEFIVKCAKAVLWIDHHEESAPLKDMGLEGIHDTSVAACILTWNYFNEGKEIPKAVRLVGDRDIWKFEDPDSEPFGHGLSTLPGCMDPSSELWQRLLENDELIPKIVEIGQVIVDKIATDNLWHARQRVFLVQQGGDEFIITNCTANISECADYLRKTFKVDKILTWDIAKGHLSLHGRGPGTRDFFGGLLKGHPEACGGSIDLPEGWTFLQAMYKNARRLMP